MMTLVPRHQFVDYDGNARHNGACTKRAQCQRNCWTDGVYGHDASKGRLAHNLATGHPLLDVENESYDRSHDFDGMEAAGEKLRRCAGVHEARFWNVAHFVYSQHHNTAAQSAARLPLCLRCDGSHAESLICKADARLRCGCATRSMNGTTLCNSPSDQTSGLSAFAHSHHLHGHHQS